MLAALGAAFGSSAFAQLPPALERVSPQERARLEPIIEGAKQEGSVSYWDAVLQPPTKDALTVAFVKRYGLPATFRVNHTLAGTATVITRVEQELHAGRLTVDVVGSASTTWVYGLLKAGHILPYESPEFAHYPRMFEAGVAEPGQFGVNGSYLLVPMWNSDQLNFTGTSWKDVIGGSAGHTQVQTTARYAHLAADPILAAADQVSKSLADCLASAP